MDIAIVPYETYIKFSIPKEKPGVHVLVTHEQLREAKIDPADLHGAWAYASRQVKKTKASDV